MTSQFKFDSNSGAFAVLPCTWSPAAANYQGAPDALDPNHGGYTRHHDLPDRLHQVVRPPGVYHCGRKTRQRSGIRLHGVTMPTRSLHISFFSAVNCQAVRDR
jgi:hypothetical protein